MQDEQEGHGYRVAVALLLIVFIGCIIAAFHTSRRFVEKRPQVDVVIASPRDVAPAPEPSPRLIIPPSDEAEKINTPEPEPTLTTEEGAQIDLNPSVDPPQESSHVENDEPAPAANAGPEIAEQPAGPIPEVAPHHAGDDDRHARRRTYHIRRGRARAVAGGACEPLCGFFKDTAHAAGLIK